MSPNTKTWWMRVRLEVMENRGLEVGASLVVFKEKRTILAGVGVGVGRELEEVGEVGRSQVAS